MARERAVLHTDNSTEFADVAAVIDAIHATRRPLPTAAKAQSTRAFQVAFATAE